MKLTAQMARIDAALNNMGDTISLNQTQDGYLLKVSGALNRMSELCILSMNTANQNESDVSRPWLWNAGWWVAGLVVGVLLTGCAAPENRQMYQSPGCRPENVFRYSESLPADIRRVAVLPLACENQRTDLQEGCEALNPILQGELIRTKKFEVVSANADLLRNRTGRLTWTGAEILPRDFFSSLREAYGCDAVLFCQLTVFRAYAPLAIGWRMKLVDVRTRQTLWAADDIVDAGEPAVPEGAGTLLADRAADLLQDPGRRVYPGAGCAG